MSNNSKPRVAHLTSAHRPNDTRIFVKECQSLARAGYDVHLVAPGGYNVQKELVSIHAFPIARSRYSRFSTSMFQIYQLAKGINADLYHIHDPDLIFVGLLLKKRGRPIVYDVHEDNPRMLLSRQYIPKKIRKPVSQTYQVLENYASRYFSAIVAATPVIGDRFQKINPNIVVINNYPIIDELKPTRPIHWTDRDQSICYVGAITQVRGALQMVQAMEFIPENFEAKLEMAGEIWPRELRRQLKTFSGWKNVKELGLISRGEVRRLFERTRAGLVLMHPTPSYIQSQPTKLFETMSAGLPVIASDFPLWRQLVEDIGCGLLANPQDPCSVAEAIMNLLRHHADAESMGARGREAVETIYNWNKEETKLLSLYKKLLHA
jgi:glycosyltransferase involved in cell wall biosynthesis